MEGQCRDVGATMMHLGREALRLLAAAAFPHRCVACGTEGKVICETCAASEMIPLEGIFVCPGCGERSGFGARCGRPKCLAATPLDGLVSAAPYARTVLRELLRLWKYERVDEAGDALVRYFGGFVRRHRLAFEASFLDALAVSVPMHPCREAYRGFDQAAALAAAFRAETGARAVGKVIRRRFRWTAQAALDDDAARRRNAKGSVRVTGDVADRSFVLIDDVATTGATLDACAAALKAAGASRVWAVTLLKG